MHRFATNLAPPNYVCFRSNSRRIFSPVRYDEYFHWIFFASGQSFRYSALPNKSMADACWKMLNLVLSLFLPFPLHLPLPHVDGLFVYCDILGGDSKRDAFTVIGSNPNVMNVIMIKMNTLVYINTTLCGLAHTHVRCICCAFWVWETCHPFNDCNKHSLKKGFIKPIKCHFCLY